MKKILIIQNVISKYRVPVYNKLSEKYDVTVVYSYNEKDKEAKTFKSKKIGVFKIYKFLIHRKSLYKICKKYDVVIALWGINWISIMELAILPRKFKLILWGIGVSASYKVRYDSIKKWDFLNVFLIRHSDAVLFYSEYPVKKYLKLGMHREKLFVANNTVNIYDCNEVNYEKNCILFIGSLYKGKRIDILIDCYNKALIKNFNIPKLYIIGAGDEFEVLKKYIIKLGLENQIELKGEIFDEKILAKYFKSSIACFSPDQAGLSVLKAMGYGVPFITMKNAITGGEIFNIKNNINGILLDEIYEIEDIILDITINKEKYINMGKKAREHYFMKCTIEKMIEGFENAIEYVCLKTYI